MATERINISNKAAEEMFEISEQLSAAPLIITLPHYAKGEEETLAAIVEKYHCRVHLRKPEASSELLRKFTYDCCSIIPTKFVSLHYNTSIAKEFGIGLHLSSSQLKSIKDSDGEFPDTRPLSLPTHSTDELRQASSCADYLFLSPLFDSVSKQGYKAAINFDKARASIAEINTPIVALGGITAANVATAKQLGFCSAALLGSLWKSRGNGEIDISATIESYDSIYRQWQK